MYAGDIWTQRQTSAWGIMHVKMEAKIMVMPQKPRTSKTASKIPEAMRGTGNRVFLTALRKNQFH